MIIGKCKELYKTVQVKAGALTPIQLLIDMKVQWSSTYVMVNRAEGSHKVNINCEAQILSCR